MKVNVRGVVKHSPQKVRVKRRALIKAILNHLKQLAENILETTTTVKVPLCN